MDNEKINLGFTKLQKALQTLEIAALLPSQINRINVDATIQRFEFTIELFWKLLKYILKSKGVEVQYPRDILKEAYKGHLINQEDQWLQMLQDRNLTTHTYDEALADQIYKRIQTYLPIFKQTLHSLSQNFQ
jgi:nucleotidyltransferase substrate binding protein (TIGR01987 family)